MYFSKSCELISRKILSSWQSPWQEEIDETQEAEEAKCPANCPIGAPFPAWGLHPSAQWMGRGDCPTQRSCRNSCPRIQPRESALLGRWAKNPGVYTAQPAPTIQPLSASSLRFSNHRNLPDTKTQPYLLQARPSPWSWVASPLTGMSTAGFV